MLRVLGSMFIKTKALLVTREPKDDLGKVGRSFIIPFSAVKDLYLKI
jgi:hypothetical protein